MTVSDTGTLKMLREHQWYQLVLLQSSLCPSFPAWFILPSRSMFVFEEGKIHIRVGPLSAYHLHFASLVVRASSRRIFTVRSRQIFFLSWNTNLSGKWWMAEESPKSEERDLWNGALGSRRRQAAPRVDGYLTSCPFVRSFVRPSRSCVRAVRTRGETHT